MKTLDPGISWHHLRSHGSQPGLQMGLWLPRYGPSPMGRDSQRLPGSPSK
jgi:hypothetical protein